MTPADKEEIISIIKQTVNGKIDNLHSLVENHNVKHEVDMVQVRAHIEAVSPILVEYKQREAARVYIKTYGDAFKWIAGVVTALGVLWALFFKS